MMVSKRLSLALTAGFVLFLAAEAQARTFSMVGSWREWCCSVVKTASGTFSGNYTPFTATGVMGGSTGSQPPGAPGNQGLRGSGIVTATGSNPANLTLMSGLIGGNTYSSKQPYNGPTFWYLGSSQNWRNDAAVFSENGGPGNFALCHGGKACATPGGGYSPTTYNWRVSNVVGDNKFGGVMRQLGFHQGVAKFHQQGAVLSVNNNLFFGFDPQFKGGSGQVRHVSGSASSTFLSTTAMLPNQFKARSGSGPPCSYTTNGTHTAGSFGTLCPGGTPVALFHLPGSTQTPTIPFPSQGTGFPWTTGLVRVSATQVQAPFNYQMVSLQGYDNRTALGKGNIQLVSPFVFVSLSQSDSFPRLLRLRLRIGQDAQTPALSAGGFAVGATVMMLLAVAFVARRRR